MTEAKPNTLALAVMRSTRDKALPQLQKLCDTIALEMIHAMGATVSEDEEPLVIDRGELVETLAAYLQPAGRALMSDREIADRQADAIIRLIIKTNPSKSVDHSEKPKCEATSTTGFDASLIAKSGI